MRRYMIHNLRRKFTSWYFKRGYTFNYGPDQIYYDCPWYVKPFVFLLSISLYTILATNHMIKEGFEEGLRRGERINIKINVKEDSNGQE